MLYSKLIEIINISGSIGLFIFGLLFLGTLLVALLYKGSLREWLVSAIGPGILVGAASLASFTIWGFAATEARLFWLWAFPVIEAGAALVYFRWSKSRKLGDSGGHFGYAWIVGILSLAAASWAMQGYMRLSRQDFNVVGYIVLVAMLAAVSVILGKTVHWYVFEKLIPMTNRWIEQGNELFAVAQEAKKQSAQVQANQRVVVDTGKKKQQAAEDDARQLKAELEALLKRIKQLRLDIAKTFTHLFIQRYHLDTDSVWGHVHETALELVDMLADSELEPEPLAIKRMDELWKEHAPGLGYYLVDRRLVTSDIAKLIRGITERQKESVEFLVHLLTPELYSDPSSPQPTTAQEANNAVSALYRSRYGDTVPPTTTIPEGWRASRQPKAESSGSATLDTTGGEQ